MQHVPCVFHRVPVPHLLTYLYALHYLDQTQAAGTAVSSAHTSYAVASAGAATAPAVASTSAAISSPATISLSPAATTTC